MTSSKSKRKGTAFESACRDYLKSLGGRFSRIMRPIAGPKDIGDLVGVEEWTFQCKNVNNMSLGTWCTDAEQQAKNGDTRFWAVLHKRRLRPIPDSYATVPVSTLAELIQHYHPEV